MEEESVPVSMRQTQTQLITENVFLELTVPSFGEDLPSEVFLFHREDLKSGPIKVCLTSAIYTTMSPTRVHSMSNQGLSIIVTK